MMTVLTKSKTSIECDLGQEGKTVSITLDFKDEDEAHRMFLRLRRMILAGRVSVDMTMVTLMDESSDGEVPQ